MEDGRSSFGGARDAHYISNGYTVTNPCNVGAKHRLPLTGHTDSTLATSISSSRRNWL